MIEKNVVGQSKPGRRGGDEGGEPERPQWGIWRLGGHYTQKWKDSGMSPET